MMPIMLPLRRIGPTATITRLLTWGLDLGAVSLIYHRYSATAQEHRDKRAHQAIRSKHRTMAHRDKRLEIEET